MATAAKNCTFYDSSKVVLSLCGVDYDGDQIAEGISIAEVEAITASATLSGTTYAASNMTDYPVTIMAVKGSELNKALEKQFLNRGCCEFGAFDYNPNAELSIVSDSVVVLSRGSVTIGSSEAVTYVLHGRFSNI